MRTLKQYKIIVWTTDDQPINSPKRYTEYFSIKEEDEAIEYYLEILDLGYSEAYITVKWVDMDRDLEEEYSDHSGDCLPLNRLPKRITKYLKKLMKIKGER